MAALSFPFTKETTQPTVMNRSVARQGFEYLRTNYGRAGKVLVSLALFRQTAEVYVGFSATSEELWLSSLVAVEG